VVAPPAARPSVVVTRRHASSKVRASGLLEITPTTLAEQVLEDEPGLPAWALLTRTRDAAVNRPSALPAQGPTRLSALSVRPGADVPVLVALVGLLLLVAGARGVGRLREAGPDDPNLTWD
jgi:hypothetical protein